MSLITSITNAVSAVFIAMGMRDSNPVSANLVCTGVQTMTLLPLIVLGLPELNWMAVAIFALSGVLAMTLGRLLYFMGVEKIGVAVSSAIIGSNPLISTLLATLLIGEVIDISTIFGAGLVVTGVYLLSGAQRRSVRIWELMIPILSAFSYALSNVIRKAALNIQSEPILGAQVGAVAGTISFLLYLAAAGRLKEVRIGKKSLVYFSAAGIIASIGWISLMQATKMGRVSVVTTIVFSYPLFSLLLSWFLLREQESITNEVITGCVVIVAGVILVSLF
ncbi:MAG: DMT family transporter [Candidatus Bathyarchaeota archaeon]